MKAAIIAFNNLKYSPYIKTYSDHLEKLGIAYDVILPNRDGLSEALGETMYAIPWDKSKSKALNFLKFRHEAIRILKKNKYDFLFVLTTMPTVLLSGYLCRHYKGRYLVDVRDYTYENVAPYFFLEKRAVRHSAMNVISAPGFRKFLPKASYCLCHNVSPAYRAGKTKDFAPTEKDPIIIGYVGAIAYKEQCIRLMRLVEKDERFCFYLYGSEGGDRRVSQYAEASTCERIRAFGPYKPEEKVGIMQGVDMLFNAYGNGNKLVDHALSNKLYDSFYMGLPLLTSPATAMSEEAGAFSFDIDLANADSLDELYDWYHQIDGKAFDEYSRSYLNQVFASQDAFYEKLNAILQGK